MTEATVNIQGIEIHPVRPRWGESLTIALESSHRAFTTTEPFYLIAFERRTEGFQTRRIPMSLHPDGRWIGQLAVPYLTFELGLTLAKPGWRMNGEVTVPVFGPDGPAPGTFAWQTVKNPDQWLHLMELEHSISPNNPFARVIFWNVRHAFGILDAGEIRSEALEMAADPQGLSPWGRRTIAYGLALSGDLDYATSAVEELARRYPGSPAVDQALRDHDLARQRAGHTDTDPLDALRERLAHKDPTRPLALERVGRWARMSQGPVSTVERIAKAWTDREPDNPLPHHYLSVALHNTGRSPHQAEQAARRALDAALGGWLWVFADAPNEQRIRATQLSIRLSRIRAALALSSAADALAHIATARADVDDALDDQTLDELQKTAQAQLRRQPVASSTALSSDERLDEDPALL